MEMVQCLEDIQTKFTKAPYLILKIDTVKSLDCQVLHMQQASKSSETLCSQWKIEVSFIYVM